MMTRSRRVLALAILLPAAAGVVAASAALSQPLPSGDRGRDRTYAAWIPPGTYTAIVLCSSGEDRRWAVSLTTTTASVPIVVRPGETVVMPFAQGWSVDPGHEARLVSRLVPFEDAAKFNLLGESPDFVLSAWGVTPAGPVQFVYREVK